MENEKDLEQVDVLRYLLRFLKTLRWTWLPILVLALLFGGYRYLRAARSFTPVYEAKAILSVSSGYNTGNVIYDTSFYDASAAQQVVETFPNLLSTDFMWDLIMAELGTNSIPGSISAKSIAETNMFELRVSGSNPDKLCDVLNAVVNAYPKASVFLVDNSQIRVLEAPETPTKPSNSFSGRTVFLRSTATALMIGLAVTFLLSLLNQTIGSEKELKEILSIPLLVSLPQLRVKKRRKNTEILIRASDDPGMAEAIRGLRAKIRKQLDDAGGKVVLLTSTVPGEGKTTAAVNLALALAAEGHRTVLVDADLRNQTIGRLLGSSSQAIGLMALMKHQNLPVEQHLQQAAGSELRFISGTSTTRRYYQLDPKALNRVLAALKEQFDYIVIDTPPSSIVSDTALLGHHADCVLYVVRQDHAGKAQIQDTVLGMHQRGLPLTGCILNGAPRSTSRHGYGYGYGYGYGRKYGYGKKYGYGRKPEN